MMGKNNIAKKSTIDQLGKRYMGEINGTNYIKLLLNFGENCLGKLIEKLMGKINGKINGA